MTTDDADAASALRELRDRAAVAELANELASWLDEKRWDDAATIFVEDATQRTPSGEFDGRDAIAAQAARFPDPSQHLIGNVAIALHGDRASVRSTVFAAVARGQQPDAPIDLWGGFYRFDARRTPDGWRVYRLEVTPSWSRPG
jgi:hypothetical protein